MSETPIIVAIKGFTNGMTYESVIKRAEEIIKKYEDKNVIYTFDGDLLKKKGSHLDTARNTPACFTTVIEEIKRVVPGARIIAFKKEDQVYQLESSFSNVTKHGSVEVGYSEEIYGPIKIIEELEDVDSGCFNVITAPSDLSWDELGVYNINYWKDRNFKVHYVSVGGGKAVSDELKIVRDVVDCLWRLETSRKNPVEGLPDDVVEYEYFEK
jgi:hypothetical protein